jgi:hypothetical protein
MKKNQRGVSEKAAVTERIVEHDPKTVEGRTQISAASEGYSRRNVGGSEP